jgi:hypothetical protein
MAGRFASRSGIVAVEPNLTLTLAHDIFSRNLARAAG